MALIEAGLWANNRLVSRNLQLVRAMFWFVKRGAVHMFGAHQEHAVANIEQIIISYDLPGNQVEQGKGFLQNILLAANPKRCDPFDRHLVEHGGGVFV